MIIFLTTGFLLKDCTMSEGGWNISLCNLFFLTLNPDYIDLGIEASIPENNGAQADLLVFYRIESSRDLVAQTWIVGPIFTSTVFFGVGVFCFGFCFFFLFFFGVFFLGFFLVELVTSCLDIPHNLTVWSDINVNLNISFSHIQILDAI